MEERELGEQLEGSAKDGHAFQLGWNSPADYTVTTGGFPVAEFANVDNCKSADRTSISGDSTCRLPVGRGPRVITSPVEAMETLHTNRTF